MRQRQEIQFETTVHGIFTGLLNRPETGFRWEADAVPTKGKANKHRAGPWLVLAGAWDAPFVDFARYPPLTAAQCRNLHRQFAALARPGRVSQPERIRRFASRFGWLDRTDYREYLALPGHLPSSEGESLWWWRSMISEFAALVALWDICQDSNGASVRRALGPYVTWQETPRQVTIACGLKDGRLVPFTPTNLPAPEYRNGWLVPPGARGPNVDYQLGPLPIAGETGTAGTFSFHANNYRMRQLSWGDSRAAVRMFLYQRLNQIFEHHVIPRLYHERPDEGALMVAPRSLLGAIAVSFALELSGRPHPSGQCQNKRCGRSFPQKHGKRRYCSDACRSQASYYRRRQAEAATNRTPPSTPRRTPKPADTHKTPQTRHHENR